jgi:hypothetical protein
MAVAAVKNVPKNPYGSLGPSPATVKKITPPAPVQSGFGWGSATNANDMSKFGYDVGTAANPATPYTPAVTSVKPATPGSWLTTDYASMIPGDWEVTDAEAQGNKLTGEAEAAFQKALRQAFIDYGGDTSKVGDYAKYIDAPTIEAARANKFSKMAQDLQAMTRSIKTGRSKLAASGASASARTLLTKNALDARELADYGATREFLGGADTGTAQLATVRAQIADKIAAARKSAADRLAAQYPSVWQPGTEEQTITTPASGGTVPLAHPSYLSPGKPESAYERALRLRSEALNKRYGLG